MERYSFILPLIKTLITKLSEPLNISKSELPNLTEVLYSGNFYDRFLPYCSTEEWTVFIETKVRIYCFIITISYLHLLNYFIQNILFSLCKIVFIIFL